jgi:hypothetical protein
VSIFANAIARITSHGAQLRDAIKARAPQATTSAQDALELTFTPGDRVIDLVTHEEVTIASGTHAPEIVSAPNPTIS